MVLRGMFLLWLVDTFYSAFFCVPSRCRAGLNYLHSHLFEAFRVTGASRKSCGYHLYVSFFVVLLVCNFLRLTPAFYPLTGNL